MNDLDKIRLFDSAIGWIFEHCENCMSYVYALDQIGYSRSQALDELCVCDFTIENINEAVNEVYGQEE